jgi:ketosteroid isomerase-like protein
MSQENVELALETFRRFKPGDDSWIELWDPEAHLTSPDGWPEQGPFVGREAIVEQFERLRADWSEWRFEDFEVKAAPGEWVVLSFRWHTRGATSGIETDFPLAVAYRIESELVCEGHFRWAIDQALEAARLRE